METLQKLKQELIEKITRTEDHGLLITLKEDMAVYEQQAVTEGPYGFPGATEEEREELIRLDKEDNLDESETVSLEEFKEVMKQWRMK